MKNNASLHGAKMEQTPIFDGDIETLFDVFLAADEWSNAVDYPRDPTGVVSYPIRCTLDVVVSPVIFKMKDGTFRAGYMTDQTQWGGFDARVFRKGRARDAALYASELCRKMAERFNALGMTTGGDWNDSFRLSPWHRLQSVTA
jgi:hypothetical protein